MATLSNLNVVTAHTKFRRFGLSFCLGVALFSWLGIYVSRQLHPSHPLFVALGHGLFFAACLIEISLLTFGIWMGRIGIAALKQGSYPPSNSKVLCDTLCVKGWRATTKALAALLLSTASLLGTIEIGTEIVALLNL